MTLQFVAPHTRMRWATVARAAMLLLLAAALGACTKAQARTPAPPPAPALEIPVPDSRLIIPVSTEPDEPPPPPPSTTSAPPTRPRDTSNTAKPPPATSSPPATPPAAPPEPPPVLQPTQNVGELEIQARAFLNSANHSLTRVQERALDSEGRANLAMVRNFMTLAQRALELKNFDYAREVANKAARLAALLVKS